jgi:diguanylate cyclase (GGDEF)-like protein/PAS domain S-box-containing protein
VISVNAAYSRMLGRDPVDLVGANLERWTHPDDLPDRINDPLTTLARERGERVEFEGRYLGSDGQAIHALATAASYLDEDAHRVAILQVLDISERERLEEQLVHLADRDPLTGLFNRRRLAEELARELTRVQRYPGRGAVLALDFDGFKFVNDTLGHAAGDRLVASLADAMKRTLRASDVIARTGGDEFVVILPEASQRAALLVAEKLRANVRQNGVCVSQDGRARVTTSIGITVFESDDQVTAVDLLVEADIAMYGAKESGRDRCNVFVRDEHRREQVAVRESWSRRLQDAVEHGRFVLHAQPIVPVCANGIPRFELLMRMQGEDGELLAPATFLPNAERFDLIQGLDHWVMSEAVQLLHRYHAEGCDLALAVNVSGKTLNARGIGRHLGGLLKAYPIPEGRLVLELAESVTIANMERARELAADLRGLGCRLALDDFGAGFATFHHLRHLEFDYIKIDGEFITRLPDTPADQVLVKAVVDIARGLGSETIAEFVQDDETVTLLHQLGVDYAQGYYTGRPGPLDDILPALQPSGLSHA